MSPEKKKRRLSNWTYSFFGRSAVERSNRNTELDRIVALYQDETSQSLINQFKTHDLQKHLLEGGRIRSWLDQFTKGLRNIGLSGRDYFDATISMNRAEEGTDKIISNVLIALGIGADFEKLQNEMFYGGIERHTTERVRTVARNNSYNKTWNEVDVANLVSLGEDRAMVLDSEGNYQGVIAPTTVPGVTLKVSGLGFTYPDNDPDNPVILTLQYQRIKQS